MKKYIPFIAVIFIAAAVIISVIPDYKKSQEPFNKLLTYAKSEGFAVGVLVKNDQDVSQAQVQIDALASQLNRSIPARYYTGDTAAKIAVEQMLGVPSFVIINGDGNLAVKVNGKVTAKKLVPYFSDLHTH